MVRGAYTEESAGLPTKGEDPARSASSPSLHDGGVERGTGRGEALQTLPRFAHCLFEDPLSLALSPLRRERESAPQCRLSCEPPCNCGNAAEYGTPRQAVQLLDGLPKNSDAIAVGVRREVRTWFSPRADYLPVHDPINPLLVPVVRDRGV